jgi:serine/threonine-protein kinase HipA
MMTIAKAMGMDVPDIQLIDVDAIKGLPVGIGELKGQALAVKRFDRTADGPVHMEDFAQVFGVAPDEKYEHVNYKGIASVLGIETGDADVAEFIRRLVFSTLIGNTDMHLKNWSLIYPDKRTPILSPAYDLLSTIPYIADDKMALNYSRTKKMAEFSKDELSHLAAKAKISEKLVLDTAAETVQRFKQEWADQKTKLPLDKKVVGIIDAHAASIPIYTEL